jgi:hypothetical protein
MVLVNPPYTDVVFYQTNIVTEGKIVTVELAGILQTQGKICNLH